MLETNDSDERERCIQSSLPCADGSECNGDNVARIGSRGDQDSRPLSYEQNDRVDDGDGGRENVHKRRMSAADRRSLKPKKSVAQTRGFEDDADARLGYEFFHKLSPGSATMAQVIKSSA